MSLFGISYLVLCMCINTQAVAVNRGNFHFHGNILKAMSFTCSSMFFGQSFGLFFKIQLYMFYGQSYIPYSNVNSLYYKTEQALSSKFLWMLMLPNMWNYWNNFRSTGNAQNMTVNLWTWLAHYSHTYICVQESYKIILSVCFFLPPNNEV